MFLRKYGAATHIYFPIVKRASVDYAVSGDWTPASGDVKISKDGGAAANTTNLPSAITMGNTAMWDLSLTATEMEAAKISITIADSATKAVEDQFVTAETYGHASAEHAVDLDDATSAGLSRLDAAITTRLAPATAGRTLVVDAAGLADANVVKVGPTGSGTAQTAGDLAAMITAVDNFVDTEISTLQTSVDDLPTNAELATALASADDAVLAAIAALNDFDPATDGVFLGNVAHGGTAAVLTLERIVVASTTLNEPAVKFTGNGSGDGLLLTGGSSGDGIHLASGGSGLAMHLAGNVTVTNALTVSGILTATNPNNTLRLGTFTVSSNAVAWNSAWDTEIQSECADALTAYAPSTHSAADVWAAATRTLTTLDEDSTTLDLDATIRAALGMASASYDTDITALLAGIADVPTVAEIWTTALTEAYRATGAAGTAAQLLHEILQNLTEFTISGTTKTVNKFDGSTTAKTYTLNDGTTPTGITEAT